MSKWLLRISIFLMIVSFAPWLMLPAVPFLPLTGAKKTAVFSGLFIAAEVLFWGGAAIGGAEIVRHRRAFMAIMRRRLGPRIRPWFGLRQTKRYPQPRRQSG